MVAAAHVAGLGLLEEARQQAKRQRMIAERPRRLLQFCVGSSHAVVAQQRRAGPVRKLPHVQNRGGAILPARDVFDSLPAGEHDEPVRLGWRHGREAPQQCAQPQVLQFALLCAEAMLQRLASVEHEQHAAPRQSFRNGLPLGGRAGRFDLDAELFQSPVEEWFGRGCALLAALAIERPAQHSLSAAITLRLHALEPFVDQRRLAGAALGDEREDVGVAIDPRLIEARQLGIAADEALVAGLWQVGDVDNARRARRLGGLYGFRPCG